MQSKGNEYMNSRVTSITEETAPLEWITTSVLSVAFALFSAVLVLGLICASVIDVSKIVKASGTLAPPLVSPVRARESGTIRSVKAHTGQHLRMGDTLFLLDDMDLREAERAARSALRERESMGSILKRLRPLEIASARERAQSSASDAHAARLRLANTLTENGIAPNVDSVLQTTPSQIHVAIGLAREAVRRADAEARIAVLAVDQLERDSRQIAQQEYETARIRDDLITIERRRAWTTLVAPEPGIVLTDGIEHHVGRMVQAGETLAEIASTRGWIAQLLVAENDVSVVRPGQRVELELRTTGHPLSLRVGGIVEAVSPQPWWDEQNTRGGVALGASRQSSFFSARVRLIEGPWSAKDSIARKGMTVTARIEVGRAKLGTVLLERLLPSGSSL